jgi:hypothetical protein
MSPLPAERRDTRQQRSRPIIDELEPWLRAKLALIGQKTKLAEGDPLCAIASAAPDPLP